MVAIGRVEVTDMGRRVLVRGIAKGPPKFARSFSLIQHFDAGRMEERHRKITREVNVAIVKANVYWKGLHQVLAVVSIVERAGAEKERHGSIDRRLRKIVPRHAKAGPAQFNSFVT